MRSQFSAYYSATTSELDRLWADALVIPDTNVLLNLYRYSPEVAQDFLGLLTVLNDRLWVPHQVALEFHQRRVGLLSYKANQLNAMEKVIQGTRRAVELELDKNRAQFFIKREQILKAFDEGLSHTIDVLSEVREVNNAAGAVSPSADRTLDAITNLLENKVGREWSEEQLAEAYLSGSVRYEKLLPPGYKDIDKDEPERYGDLVLWLQVLEYATSEAKSVIFITADQKEDWWRREAGQTIGPRVELVKEFERLVKKQIVFYSPEQFIKTAMKRELIVSNVESVDEAEAVARDQQENVDQHQLLIRMSELEERDTYLNRRLSELSVSKKRELDSHRHILERARREYELLLRELNAENLLVEVEARNEPEGLFSRESQSMLAWKEQQLSDARARLQSLSDSVVALESSVAGASVASETAYIDHQLKDVREELKSIKDGMLRRFAAQPR